jgi:hypothetical protein
MNEGSIFIFLEACVPYRSDTPMNMATQVYRTCPQTQLAGRLIHVTRTPTVLPRASCPAKPHGTQKPESPETDAKPSSPVFPSFEINNTRRGTGPPGPPPGAYVPPLVPPLRPRFVGVFRLVYECKFPAQPDFLRNTSDIVL